MQVAIWKLHHINDPDVPDTSGKNGSSKSHDEVLQPLWKTGDLLPTNSADILEHQNTNETDKDELDFNDDSGWHSDKYDKEIDCDVHGDGKFND